MVCMYIALLVHQSISVFKVSFWAHKTSLTPQLFIEVPVLSQANERSCIYVLGTLNLPFSTILIIDFKSLPTVYYRFILHFDPSYGKININTNVNIWQRKLSKPCMILLKTNYLTATVTNLDSTSIFTEVIQMNVSYYYVVKPILTINSKTMIKWSPITWYLIFLR